MNGLFLEYFIFVNALQIYHIALGIVQIHLDLVLFPSFLLFRDTKTKLKMIWKEVVLKNQENYILDVTSLTFRAHCESTMRKVLTRNGIIGKLIGSY